MELTQRDEAFLHGEAGEATQLAMELLVAVGEAMQAPHLIDVEAAHIDGCLFHGQAGLDFARRLVAGGGEVRIPTTLNVTSLDLLHPELYRGDRETAESAREQMTAYEALGCRPTWTCAPYLLPDRPHFGQQIAWGESNAIVFANSVLGARTNRYGDFMDICCALTGRAPYNGLHTDDGRLASLQVEIDVPDSLLDTEVLYPLLGNVVGTVAGNEIPLIIGLDDRANEDRLRSLGAAAASSGAVGMFHVLGVTPEAGTIAEATGDQDLAGVTVGVDDLERARARLSTARGHLAAVSVGTPHISLAETRTLASLMTDRRTSIPFYVNIGRDVLQQAEKEGLDQPIQAFGAVFVTDTCTYITPIIEDVTGDVMTNSGKWAFYAPANLGVGVAFGGLSDCVASAVAGSPQISTRLA